MFQATQSLMFRPIASLGHFKIHTPLPLNPRESTQLLNLLTTSFRQQLDREHGTFRNEACGASKPTTSQTSTPKRHRHSHSKPDLRGPTDRHLHSVLTNPLFTYGPEKQDTSSRSTRDPMDIFEEACAKGFMKIEYAAACLKAKKNMIVQSSALSVRDAMKSSNSGAKVLQWLVSSGTASDVSFLREESFSDILINFLVAEELQAVVWIWLNRLFETSSTSMDTAGRLLDTLVRAEASGFASLDNAYSSLERARDQLIRLQLPTRPVLSRAGLFLSRESTLQSSSHPPPSAAMFDLFLRLVPTFTARTDLHLSHLLLHHPTKPSTCLALKFLKSMKSEDSVSAESPTRRLGSHRSYPDSRLISIGLDAARHLLEKDEHADAKWVMEFLQENYAKQLGLTQKKQFEQAQAEASSLELLRSLNLA